jgi:hypothetical protein
MTKGFLTEGKMSLPKIGINELIRNADMINVNIEELNRVIDENFIENIFLHKFQNARKSLYSGHFGEFWKFFVYFTKGEIETKILIKYLINPQNSEIISPSIWDKQVINLSSQMIRYRQKLVELLYNIIISTFKNIQVNKSKLGIYYQIQNMNFIIISALKKSFSAKSIVHAQTLDDIELSLNSALILGNSKYTIP